MANHLKQTGTEDTKVILSVDDSAKSLYDECKKISRLIVDYNDCSVNKELIFGSEPWCRELRKHSDEFAELFRSLIKSYVLEQRLSILDIAHPLKEENPVAVVCKTLGVDELKVKDTMTVLREGISIVDITPQQGTSLVVVRDLRKIENMPPEEKTDLKVKDVVDMIYKKSDPGLYSLIMKNMQPQRLEELFYGYTPNLICNLDENVIKLWGYLEITPHAMADRIGLIVVDDVAKLIEKGAEQFNCLLEYGGIMVIPVNKIADTVDKFARIYKNRNPMEWMRLETLRVQVKEEKDETIGSFLFNNYKSEILKIAKEAK